MKRLIGILLAFTLLLPVSPAIAQESDVISRGAFVSALAVLLPDVDREAADLAFSDLGQDNTYYADIAKARLYGLVKGDPDGLFRPEEPVTAGEALAMAVRVIDDEQMIVKERPYPLGHLFYAQDYGIGKGVAAQADEYVTNGTAETIINNLKAYIEENPVCYIPGGVKTASYRFDADTDQITLDFDVVPLGVAYPQFMIWTHGALNDSPNHRIKIECKEKSSGDIVREVKMSVFADISSREGTQFDQIMPNRHLVITISPVDGTTFPVEGELLLCYNQEELEL